MNKSFKVVFSKARSALMVVNEATSSIQAKGTKTVIAAAAAAMIAGGAVAATTTYDEIEVGTGATLSFTAAATGGAEAAKFAGVKAHDSTDTTDPKVYVENASGTQGNFATTYTLKVSGGTVDFNASKDNDLSKTYSGSQFTSGVINIGAYGLGADKTGDKKVTLGFDTDAFTFTEGAINFKGLNLASNSVSSITSAEAITLGVVSDETLGAANPGKVVALTVDANSNASVSGAKTVTLNNVAIDNKGTLVINGTEKVSVLKDSTVANTGKLTISSTADVQFDADYTAAEAGSETLTVSGATVSLGGAIKGADVKLGVAAGADASKETAKIFVTSTNGVTVNGSVEATGTLILGGTTTVAEDLTTPNKRVPGVLTAAKTSVSTADVVLNNSGSVALGDLTVTDSGSLTVTNGTHTVTGSVDPVDNDFTINTLTVAKKADGSASGAFTVASGTVTLVGAGSKNQGTITLGSGANTAKLVIAKGADLTNDWIIKSADGSTGTVELDVAGTLTNNKDITATTITVDGTLSNTFNEVKGTDGNVDASKSVHGKITATTLNIKGTVNTSLDGTKSFVVTNTNLEQGGTLNVNEYNANVVSTTASDRDGLELKTAFNLNGGAVKVGDAVVANYKVAGGALNVNADGYTFDTVKVDTGSFAVDGADTLVKTLALTGGAATLTDAALRVDTKLTTTANTGVVTMTGSTLTTNVAAMGYSFGEGVLTALTGGATTAATTISLDQNSVLAIEGLTGTVKKEGVDTLKGLLVATTGDKGLIDLGAAELDIKAETDGTIDYTKLTTNFAGVTTDSLKKATVSGVDGNTNVSGASSWGNVELSSGTALGIGATTVTLNGEGQLVTYQSGSGTSAKTMLGGVALNVDNATFTKAGAGTASVGAITKTGTSGTTVNVEGGVLNVEGGMAAHNVNVKNNAAVNVVLAADQKADALATTVDTAFSVDNGASFATDGALTMSGAATGTVNGKIKVGTLTVGTGAFNVGNVDDSTYYAGTAEVDALNGQITVHNVTSGNAFAGATSVAAVKSVAAVANAQATVVAGENSLVALGTNSAVAALAAYADSGLTIAETDAAKKQYSWETRTVNRLLVVDGQAGVAATTRAASQATPVTVKYHADGVNDANYGVVIGENDGLYIDANSVDSTGTVAIFNENVRVDDGAIVSIGNAANGQKFLVTTGTATISNGANAVFNGDLLMGADYDEQTKTVGINIVTKDELAKSGLSGAGVNAAYNYFAEGANLGNTSKAAQFMNYFWSSSTSPFYDKVNDEVNVPALNNAMNSAAAVGATTGVQTMTMDAVNQMAETVQDRVSVLTQRAAGVNVWAAANGGNFQAKTLFDGAGYKSNIYSGVLGVDYQFACNAVLGAALTIGTADTDSKNTAFGTSTDSDLVGFSVYTSKTFADIIGVSADIGYLSASNDVTANGYGFGYKFSEDTDAFTIGLRGEVLTQAGAVKIVPHIGLRYTALSTDSYEAAFKTDVDDQNIFQMPVGVTVSGDFQTGDWTVAPKFDLSVVPTFGDKDAEMKLGIAGVKATDDLAVRVIDSNPVQATLGVNATNGAWGFGLNYKLGVGSDDRMNNTFNVNVRYAF